MKDESYGKALKEKGKKTQVRRNDYRNIHMKTNAGATDQSRGSTVLMEDWSPGVEKEKSEKEKTDRTTMSRRQGGKTSCKQHGSPEVEQRREGKKNGPGFWGGEVSRKGVR